MISVIVCHKNINHLNEFVKSTEDTIGKIEYEIIVVDNTKSEYYLTSAYNEGVRRSNGDVLIFAHEDVRFETKNWGNIIEKIFKNTKDIGVLGVAGTNLLLTNGQWWFPGTNHMYGEVIHESNGRIWKTIFSKGSGEKEVVVLDGVFMACKKEALEKDNIQWDEEFDNFHFYDLSFCIPFLKKGYKNYVTYNISIKHFGMGETTAEWEHYRHVFVNKFQKSFPFKIRPDIEFDGKRVPWITEVIREP